MPVSCSLGDGSKECMWYHNGAWRIGSYNWLDTKDLGVASPAARAKSFDFLIQYPNTSQLIHVILCYIKNQC